ncbi:MAG: OsmC family protein [Bacteroidota bacterium]
MTDKSKELRVSLQLVNDKLHFLGRAGDLDPVSIDYTPPLGDNLGYTSLEMLLLSLSSCVGSAVLVLLRKMGKHDPGLEIHASGTRRQEHPTCFSLITLDLRLKSATVTEAELVRVIGLADDKLCPVYAMIRGNVEVVIQHTLVAG